MRAGVGSATEAFGDLGHALAEQAGGFQIASGDFVGAGVGRVWAIAPLKEPT